MSDSESDPDDRPDVEALTFEEVHDLAREVETLKAEGQVMLTGPASVQLVARVDEAVTPQEAVEMVIREIGHSGLDIFTFAVTDMLTGEDHFVQAGQLVVLDESRAAIEASGGREG